MAKSSPTGDQKKKLIYKRNSLLALVRKYPGISRREAAEIMRQSTFTLSRMTQELMDAGLILEDEALSSHGGVGRPSRPLRLNPAHASFAGLDIEATALRCVVLDFSGGRLFECCEPFGPEETPAGYAARINAFLKRVAGENAALWKNIAGIGVGAPGICDCENGVIRSYRLLSGFENISALDMVEDLVPRTALIHNLPAVAIRDLWRREHSEKKAVIHVSVRSGIGASMQQEGRLFAGAHGLAGEFGLHSLSSPDDPARRVTFEEIAGLAALRRKLPGLPDAFWNGEPAAVEAAWGAPEVRAVLEPAMRILGHELANLVILCDPHETLVYSSLFREENVLWRVVRAAYGEASVFADIFGHPLVRAGDLGYHIAEGAAFHAMECAYPNLDAGGRVFQRCVIPSRRGAGEEG
jgi:N-acetylglucosamine repressor